MPDRNDPIHGVLLTARAAFIQRFGRAPRYAAAAPGRVNLIGEHTDYNEGFVLPAAIDRWTVAVGDRAAAPGAVSTLRSHDFDDEVQIDLRRDGAAPVSTRWANYPLGVAMTLRNRGLDIPNLDLLFTSTVPVGSGLSSSAAIEVATATLLEQVTEVTLDPVEKALLLQRAEHEFAKTPCGIMDQMISILAKPDHALLLDCRSNESTFVELPPTSEVVLLIADANVRHDLSSGAYARRRSECVEALTAIQSALHLARAIQSLRDITRAQLESARPALTDHRYRRAKHVIEENRRVIRAVEALRSGDLNLFGAMMFESHQSLRDDYEVSCDELDTLVELAAEFSVNRGRGSSRGVFGSRMTGGGFGGCTITLARPDAATDIERRMIEGFQEKFGASPAVFTTGAVGGGAIL